ncbi:MAG: metallophosphoesterase [Anaerovoracaceae bacterium]|jgi:3',5'-cyclic AMP phosphodiesterase CpdA
MRTGYFYNKWKKRDNIEVLGYLIIATAAVIMILIALAGCTSEGFHTSTENGSQLTENRSFSFIYMGDPQADPETGDYSPWGSLLSLAAEDEREPAFVLISGDLVNDGNDRTEWQAFFEAGKEVLDRLPLYPAMGNHDNTELFKELFDLPQNGPVGKEDAFYSFDYGDVHFTVLDSNAMGAADPADVAWLKEDLAGTEKSYRIVMFHHPPYTAADIPKDEIRAQTIREIFVPILEEYNVDLVLSGHQHVYMRTHPIRNGEIREDGIVYLVSASGGKQYTPMQRDYTAFAFGNRPVYSICTVDEAGILLETRDSEGNPVDSCRIGEKQPPLSFTSEQQNRTLTITDKDSGKQWSYSLKELAELPDMGFQHLYSTVNNWPSPSTYAAKGIKIRRILEEMNIYDKIQTITFRSADGYEVSFTKDQILTNPRWYFPLFDKGLADDAQPVEPILAYAYKEGSLDLEDAVPEPLCLILGQTNPAEHTNPAFVEDVTEIIFSAEEPEVWEPASTFPGEGNIASGETVKLQHPYFGLVKLHYTLDGTEPTELSPMYNPSTYRPELNVPISITEDTVIKVITVGYGKRNSPVATYTFTVR